MWIVLIVTAFIFVGGAREIIFVNINEQLEFNQGRRSGYFVLDHLSFMNGYSNSTLSRGKWALTVVFMLVNLALSVLAIKKVLREPRAVKWLLYLFLAGFIVSAAVFVVGKVIFNDNLGYLIARKVMGALQSPFPLMFLVPALYLVPDGE